MERITHTIEKGIGKIRDRIAPVTAKSVFEFISLVDIDQPVRVEAVPFLKGFTSTSFVPFEQCFAAEAEGRNDQDRRVVLWEELACFPVNDASSMPCHETNLQHVETAESRVVRPLESVGFTVVFHGSEGVIDAISRDRNVLEMVDRGLREFPPEAKSTLPRSAVKRRLS